MPRAPKIVVPAKVEERLSPEREELIRNIGTDDQLRYWNRRCCEHYLVRVETAYRDRATVKLKVRGEHEYRSISYSLKTDERMRCEIVIETLWDSTRVQVKHAFVWAYCKHRAAEAMLAVRNLHKQHTKRAQRSKAKRETERATV